MLITRKSMISGVTRSLDIPITHSQIQNYNEGTTIQRAFPQLSPSEREFMMTGATDEEWDDAFGGEEE